MVKAFNIEGHCQPNRFLGMVRSVNDNSLQVRQMLPTK